MWLDIGKPTEMLHLAYFILLAQLPTGPFGGSIVQEVLVVSSDMPRGPKRCLTNTGWLSDPYLPSGALHGPHCPSCDFTCSAKPALEKQTSQLGLSMQQCTGSISVWLSAGPKWNRPSVTFRSVFQYPVTYMILYMICI